MGSPLGAAEADDEVARLVVGGFELDGGRPGRSRLDVVGAVALGGGPAQQLDGARVGAAQGERGAEAAGEAHGAGGGGRGAGGRRGRAVVVRGRGRGRGGGRGRGFGVRCGGAGPPLGLGQLVPHTVVGERVGAAVLAAGVGVREGPRPEQEGRGDRAQPPGRGQAAATPLAPGVGGRAGPGRGRVPPLLVVHPRSLRFPFLTPR
ncbi:hypothetical protein DQ392_02990 [Streptomyces reniochalinae]|uniref:Uncharacterized protein n=1 Tax=Streptomyces reniochalinae TaxID=2250578 RepID=A0A367F2M7_9ACTN|nr:hypothetical protein DQ392_02990 [Streptomyces reniochalinae]